MKTSFFAILIAFACSPVLSNQFCDPAHQFVNPFAVPGNWYKANLHTHTNNSDGDVNAPVRIEQYRKHGYNVVVLTDHWKTNDVSRLSTKDMLIISGMEADEPRQGQTPYHIVCINVPRDFNLPQNTSAQQKIDRIKAAGGEALYAHPYWSGLNINDGLALKGCFAVEVYNASCIYNNKAYNSVHWDDLLCAGRKLPAVAADDAHSETEVARGWIMFKAPSLTADAFLKALRTGCFYSSCGPEIKSFAVDGNTVSLKCSPVKEIHFVGPAWTGKSFFSSKGQSMNEAKAQLEDAPAYIRAEVIDGQGRHAWTNPIYLK